MDLTKDISTISWAEVNKIACKMASDISGVWDYLGQEKTLTLGGYTVSARLIDVAKDTLVTGKTGGFTFQVIKGFLGKHKYYSTTQSSGADYPDSYYNSELRDWIESLTFGSDIAPYLQNFKVTCRGYSGRDYTFYTKLAPLSVYNLAIPDAFSSSSYVKPFSLEVEGPHYTMPKVQGMKDLNGNTPSDTGTRTYLMTQYTEQSFFSLSDTGAFGGINGGFEYYTSLRFCIGSS